MRVVSVAQMRDLENQANAGGMGFDRMMDAAGKRLADTVDDCYWADDNHTVVGLVGSGNNGGDTLVALTRLIRKGWTAKAYLLSERKTDDPLAASFLRANGEIFNVSKDEKYRCLIKWVKGSHIILDGILGTGISLPLRGNIPLVLKTISSNLTTQKVVAVDCPSGVDCDSGEAAEECIKADKTVCMAAVKKGLLEFPAFSLVGSLTTIDIGLPKSLPAWKSVTGEVMMAKKAASLLLKRPEDSHKGTFGACIVIAGSVNYCGAVLLAGEAVYKSGAGLVRAAIPGAIYDAIAGQLPEATWLVLPHTDGIINVEAVPVIRRNLEKITALLIGPGMGNEPAGQEFLASLLTDSVSASAVRAKLGFRDEEHPKKTSQHILLPAMIFDADGLRLLTKIKDWPSKLHTTGILTPHPGEMAALTGLSLNEIKDNKIDIALQYARDWKQVVVLKGALTVTADPGGKYMINPVATSALATAGTGDVLAGIIAGFAAQGLGAYSAAVLGVWLHAQAGLIAADQVGAVGSVTAGDVLKCIPAAIKATTGIQC